jgi:hypothetical protein
MEAAVVKCNIYVENIAILEDILVRDTMAYDFVDGCAY